MCNAFADSVDESSQKEKFVRQDITKGKLPPGVTFNQVWREMYVVEENGTMYAGGDAMLRVMEEYPGWRWLAWIGKLPGIRQCVRVGYRLIANNRHRISWRK